MAKESKYMIRERLKRMGVVTEPSEKNNQSYLDNELIQAIDKASFWETLEDLIKEGANPNVKTKNGVTIFSGVDRIFSAWFDRDLTKSKEEGVRRIDYLTGVLNFIKEESPDIDFDGDCCGHTLLEKVSLLSKREGNFELFAPLFKKLLELGADPYSNKGFRQPIQWLKNAEKIPNHPMAHYIAEMEKEALSKAISNEKTVIIKTKTQKRL